jgi:hypothetical protein
MQFNSTEAQQIAASGNLIGLPLGPSSTSSSLMATSSSSPSSTMSTSFTASPTASPNDNPTEIGAIVGGVVGGVLGVLLIRVLIWWISRHRRPSAGLSMSTSPLDESKGPTPALVKMAVPVLQCPPHTYYPSSMSSPVSTSHGTGNPANGSANGSAIVAQNAPGASGHSGTSMLHPYATTGIGPTFTPPSMASSTSGGQPSNEQRMSSASSQSMIARFVFPHRRHKRHSDAPSTLSQGSSRMSQIGILQSSPPNVGHLPQISSSSSVSPDPASLEPTPYVLLPLPQGSVPSSTSYPQEKARISLSGYKSPDTAIPSPPLPISAVQAHTTQPLDTDINRMIVATPAPMPEPPSYFASQVESREEQLRRAVSNATARTCASSSNILPAPSTPDRTGGPLSPVPERVASPHDESDYPREKV